MRSSPANLLFHGLLATLLCLFVVNVYAAPERPAPDGAIAGTVIETMSGSGYTYVQIDTADGPVWAAMPESQVRAGERIALLPGMVMSDFHSKAFNRTFAAIMFSPGFADRPPQNVSPTEISSPAPTIDPFAAAVAAERQDSAPQPPPEQRSGGSMAATAPFLEIQVAKAEGDNAYSVAEVFAKAEELNGTVIRIQGKVVKYNANIMGRNWVHLQDGTGDPLHNTHDLVATTDQDLAPDQIVTLEGTVAAAKDFGAGYTYEVLLEQARIVD